MAWRLDHLMLAAVVLAVCFVAACSRGTAEERTREPVVAGQFYPSRRIELKEAVEHYLSEGAKKAKVEEAPIALIAPHAGYQFSGRCAGVAYATVKGRSYRRVIILAVNHSRYPVRGAAIVDVDAYRTPLGKVPVDRAACDQLLKAKLFGTHPAADRSEHSLEVHLPFLQEAIGSFELVPITVGHVTGEDAAAIAAELRKVVDDGTLVVASSDFTHYGEQYGYAPFHVNIRQNLEKLDTGAVELILKRDAAGFSRYLDRTGATICGRNPITVLLNLLPDKATGQLLNYYTSGALAGDYSLSVGYAASAFTAPGKWGRPAEPASAKGEPTKSAPAGPPQAAGAESDPPKGKDDTYAVTRLFMLPCGTVPGDQVTAESAPSR